MTFSRICSIPICKYSCAYWKDAADTLEAAQQAKLKLICEKLATTGDACWISAAVGAAHRNIYMATHYGVSVVGVTSPPLNNKMAQTRCEGLDVSILLEDYRDPTISLTESSRRHVRTCRAKKLQHLF